MNASRGGGADDRYAQIEATRRGAHRARPTPLASLAPIAAVVGVVLVVLVGLWALAGGLGGDGGGESASEAGGASATHRSERTPETKSPAPTDSPAEEPGATGEVDRLAPVNVLNNTGTAGLAKAGADRLKAAGWQIGQVGNHRPPGSVPATSVFYATPDQAATAKAVAGDVGASQVQRSPGLAAGGITVILAADFQQ